MAFNDTLFQLGMDLTRSSTAQKEDFSCVESDAETVDRMRDSGSAQSTTLAGSTTLSIDLNGAKRLDDVKSVERCIKRAADSLDLKLSGLRFSRTSAGDVTGEAVLATGRISLRACSRSGHVVLDANGCAGLKPETALIALADAFEAREAVIQKARRLPANIVPAMRSAPEIARKSAKQRIEAKAA